MADRQFYFSKDIEEMLKVKTTKAYQIIVTLNQELVLVKKSGQKKFLSRLSIFKSRLHRFV